MVDKFGALLEPRHLTMNFSFIQCDTAKEKHHFLKLEEMLF
jgi:hypothetical protein